MRDTFEPSPRANPAPEPPDQPHRMRFWFFSFLWAPTAAYLWILLVSYLMGRKHPLLWLVLSNLALAGCLASLGYSIVLLWRSSMSTEGRVPLLVFNSMALVACCLFGSLLVAALIAHSWNKHGNHGAELPA